MAANETGPPIHPSEAEMAGDPKEQSNNNNQIDQNRMAAMPQQSIFVLNYDCIEKAVSLLPLNDLTAIAATCTRLRDIARSIFLRHHRALDLGSCDGGRPVGSLKQLRQILMMFGDLILNLTVDYRQLTHLKSHRILNLITRYRPENLMTLRLNKFNINEDMGSKLKPIFSNLTELELVKCTFVYSAKLFRMQATEFL